MSVVVSEFGTTKEGEQIKKYTMENKNGMKAVFINYGANLTELYVKDREGNLQDVVWGYEEPQGYEVNGPGLGSPIGRNANRIGGAKVTIEGVDYELLKNDGNNNLHGGVPGYNKRMWKGIILNENKVEFSMESPHMDQGFPGNARVKVTYTLTDENLLKMTYEASADKATIFNMTNHSYFNLEGADSESVLDHDVWISAKAFTPTDAELIPTGEIAEVEGTPMDFREWRKIGADIDADYEPLTLAGGYDHNYVLDKKEGYDLTCKMKSEKTGIVMEVYTDLPGMQFYTANFLLDEKGGKNGRIYPRRSAACFESQAFPDANHHENFPNTIYKALEVYKTTTGYKFDIEK